MAAVTLLVGFCGNWARAEKQSNYTPRNWDEWRSLGSTDSPVVFRNGNKLRFYFRKDSWQIALRGSLSKSGTPSPDYEFQLVKLRYIRYPLTVPKPSKDWQQALVISGDAYQQLLKKVVARLAPVHSGAGYYYQTAFGDGVLYRDAQSKVQRGKLEALPEDVRLERRYGIHEFGIVFAREIEAVMTEINGGHDLVCLVPPPNGPHMEFNLYDRKSQQAIHCMAPLPATDPRRRASYGAGVSDLVSFILKDHAWAILKNPVSSVARLLDKSWQVIGGILSPRLRSSKEPPPPVNTNSAGMNLPKWEQWLDRHTGTDLEAGSVKLLVGGQQFYPAFTQRLQEAQSSIHLLACIFDNDDVAVGLADILREKAKSINVAVILDRFSTRASSRVWPVTPMPEGFRPPKSIGSYLKRDSQVNLRSFMNTWASAEHSKVFLVDGTYAYVGGMNLGREYRYEWHDLMTEIEGPIVASLEWEFAKSWSHAGMLGDLAFVSRKWFAERPDPVAGNKDYAWLRRLNTRTARKSIRTAVLEALRRAEKYVYLENAYLFSNEVIVALAKARQRGVDVRVILGTKNNIFGGRSSNLVVANYLLRNGARVFLYPGMSHVKAILVDGWACWGSANFSGLSLKNNLEANLATSNEAIAAKLRQQLFEPDFESSLELTEPLEVRWTDSLSQSLLNQL